MSLSLRTSSEEETLRLGEILGRLLAPGMTVLLRGDLGTGKTVFVRGIGRAMGVGRVRSPSFTLVNEYSAVAKSICLVHADLYRLEPDDVDGLGLEEYVEDGCILLVEWPERWRYPPESDFLNLDIVAKNETERTFFFSAVGVDAEKMLEHFAADTAVKEDMPS